MTSEEEMEESNVEIVDTNQFELIVNKSGLEQNKAQFLLQQFENHYKMAAEWAKKAKQIVVTNETQTVTMKQARVGRLFLREKRLEIENARKRLKEDALKEGKAIDMIANFLKDLIIPTEEHLDRQEHFIEYKKKAEDERILAEAHAKAEEERIKKEEEDAKEKERLRLENEKLRKENEEKERINKEELERVRKENEKALQAEQEKIRKIEEEIRLKKQAELKAEAERIKEEERKKSAGDDEKITELYNYLMNIPYPEVKGHKATAQISVVKGYIFTAMKEIKPKVNEEEL